MKNESTHDAWNGKLPFYVAGTLPVSERTALQRHLEGCETCRAELRQWQLLATAARSEAAAREVLLPPLSPVVRASLSRRPSAGEAVRSAVQLVWAQWRVLRVLLPGAVLVLLLGVLGTLALRDDTQAALPLLTLAPIVAAVSVAFLHHSESDPAWEVVAATPTSTGALVFARLTLILTAIVIVMLVGSFAVSVVTGQLLASLIAAWLGPLLLLSALATVLAIRWTAAISAGVCLALWVTIISMLVKELAGDPLLTLSLQPLLDPGWVLFGGQLVAAALLWYLSLRLARGQLVLSGRLT
ncbi:MAG: zf-HC2 domain-containing protein [Ardenticatenaceae bacterium]|nr:zf-HC2 domain-containing protein [Ardenticatenaceae bacterium]